MAKALSEMYGRVHVLPRRVLRRNEKHKNGLLYYGAEMTGRGDAVRARSPPNPTSTFRPWRLRRGRPPDFSFRGVARARRRRRCGSISGCWSRPRTTHW